MPAKTKPRRTKPSTRPGGAPKTTPPRRAKQAAPPPIAPTLVTFLLDRTQSMQAIKSATIESFNGYLAGLQRDPAGIDFTLLQFDSISLDKLYVAVPVATVAPLTRESFQPRGSTPLIDACVKTIRAVADSLLKREDRPKVVICFQTDGEENVSREHTWVELNELIRLKTLEGWQFLFLGVGIDSYQQASRMGIKRADTVATTFDPQQMQAAYASASANTMSFARGMAQNTSFSAEQKMMSGDVYDKGGASPFVAPLGSGSGGLPNGSQGIAGLSLADLAALKPVGGDAPPKAKR